MYNSKIIALFFTLLFIYSTNDLAAQNAFLLNSSSFAGLSQSEVAFADIDGDNDQDVIIAGELSGASSTKLYKNDGNGNFTVVNGTPFSGVNYGGVAFADIDGDNDQDVIITGFTSGFNYIAELFTNDGAGNFTLVTGTPFIGLLGESVEFMDIDGDMDQDVVLTGYNFSNNRNEFNTYKNDGAGNFVLGYSSTQPNPVEILKQSISYGDIDGDMDIDIHLAGKDTYLVNDGNGNFSSSGSTFNSSSNCSSSALLDIDNDNDLDLLMEGASPGLYTNDGAGNFTLVNGTPFSTSGSGVGSIATGDIDNDNDQDVYFSNNGSGGIYINDGNGNFYLENSIVVPLPVYGSVAFMEVDGDNLLDLMISGEGATQLYNNTFTETSIKNSIDFDGTNIYTAPHDVALHSLPMTIEFWIKDPYNTTVGLMRKLDGNNGFQIGLVGGQITSHYGTGASSNTFINQVFSVADGNWHHIALVYDNTGTKLYGDGVLQTTVPWTGTAGANSATADFTVGRWSLSSGFFNGLMDELRIWNTTRTPLEIREHMYTPIANPSANNNLVAYYDMSNYIGAALLDKSSLYNALTISGGSITTADQLLDFAVTTTNSNSNVQNSVTTIGNLIFDDASANGNDPFDNVLEVIVAEVVDTPNTTAGITQSFIDSKYYVVQLYGAAGTFDLSLSIACDFPNGSAVTLYRRDDHSMGNWMVSSTGTVTNGKAIFNGITSFSQLVVASGVALPIDLISFSARQAEEQVRLDWATASETNNKGFEIERLENNNDWKMIGEVEGNGSSNTFHTYSFYDKNPTKGINYYRLKQIDFDGKYEYSNIQSVSFEGTKSVFSIFPNPTHSNNLNIQVPNDGTGISIFDSNGQLKYQVIVAKGTNEISLQGFSSGIYFIKFINGVNVETQRLIINE